MTQNYRVCGTVVVRRLLVLVYVFMATILLESGVRDRIIV